MLIDRRVPVQSPPPKHAESPGDAALPSDSLALYSDEIAAAVASLVAIVCWNRIAISSKRWCRTVANKPRIFDRLAGLETEYAVSVRACDSTTNAEPASH